MGQKRIEWTLGLALMLAAAALYARTGGFQFVNYDDPDYVSSVHVRGGLTPGNIEWAFTSSYAANWFPLTWISHMADRDLFGDRAGGPHLVNVAMHALSTLLLFTLLHRLTHSVWRSAFVALVFAVHPLHAESVAWVAERKDVLCGVFWMLALWAYVRYVQTGKRSWYAALVAAFVSGVMAKAMIVTLPFALLLIDAWPLHRFSRKSVIEKVPLMAISFAASAGTFLVQKTGGAVSSTDQFAFGMRISNALVSYIRYAADFLWPANLAVFYPYHAVPLWQAITAGALLAAVTACALRRDYLAVGWFWFLGTMIPMIGLVQVGLQARADRYTYIPLIGLAIMLAWGAAEVLEGHRTVLGALAAGGAAAMFLAAWIQIGYWRDSSTLFTHAIDVTDGNYVAYNNLGVAMRQSAQFAGAIANFENAVRIKPNYADAESNLGEALLAAGRSGDAIPHLMTALRIDSRLPEAHVNLAAALSRAGRPHDAEIEYRAAIGLNPDDGDAHGGLGVALTEQGKLQDAIPELAESVRIKPDDADGHYNLGRALGLAGRSKEAIGQFEETIRLQPANAEAHFNLGNALAASDRMSDAANQFGEATRLKPEYAGAHFNYASALASLGRFDEAIREFSETLRLQPDFPHAKESLEYCRELRRQK